MNTGLSMPSRPPAGASTSPVRRCTTRAPASLAFWVAASQSRHTSARNPRARRRGLVGDVVAGVAVVADRRGRQEGRARRARRPRAASTSVGTLRLSRINCLRAPLHGRSPMPTPPSPTTASTPSNVPGSIRPAGGSQPRSSGAAGVRRTRRSTSCPAARRWATRAVPIRPDEPEMTTRTEKILAETARAHSTGSARNRAGDVSAHGHTSNSPDSSRVRIAETNRPASAPSTRRWS